MDRLGVLLERELTRSGAAYCFGVSGADGHYVILG
jgi:hypothetical protein